MLTFDAQEENKKLANDILYRHYFHNFKEGDISSLELFVLGQCKANCEYCYLKKQGSKLYPLEGQNLTNIINNLQTILNWYKKNEFICPLDIFSGEWLTTEYRDAIFNTIYDNFKNIDKRPNCILIPDNMQFLKNEEATKKVIEWIEKFKKLGIPILISASIDGKYCDNGRTPNEDEFYKKVFELCEKYHFYAHPMVSAHNIDYWIDNYVWWRENAPKDVGRHLMMLEVRNEDWTQEKIQSFIRFLDFLIDYRFKNDFNENKEEFLKYILRLPGANGEDYGHECSYENITFNNMSFDLAQDSISCSFYNNFCIRLGDLAVPICHRTSYEELLIGKFNLTNDENIMEFEPTNLALLNAKCNIARSALPHCENCPYIGVCVGFCCGNSYENCKNLFIPTKEVCDLYKAKYSFLLYKYNQMGLFDYMDSIQSSMRPQYFAYIQNLIESVNSEIKNNEISK